MERNTAIIVRSVDVMNVRNTTEKLIRNIGPLVSLKDGKYGGENG